MSFTLPYAGNYVALKQRREPIVVEQQQQDDDEYQLFVQQKRELESVIEQQKERIQSLRTAFTVEVECDEHARRPRLFPEKQDPNPGLASLASKLNDLNLSWREARQASDDELKGGEMQSKLFPTLSRTADLRDELKDSEKQIVTIDAFMCNCQDRISAVRLELQERKQRVRWLLECQVIDDQSFANRIRAEEEILRQFIETRNEMEKEVSQLDEKKGLEILPLKEDVCMLERYLEEMRRRTHELQLQYQDLRNQVEEAKKAETELLEHTALPSSFRYSLKYVDEQLIRSLNERLETTRYLHPSPISVNMSTEQWLQNYYVVWKDICNQCTGLLQDAKSAFADNLATVKESIKRSQEELDVITGIQSKEGKERQVALLTLENLLHLMYEEENMERELLQRIEETAKKIGEEPISYLSLVNAEGYDDIIEEEHQEMTPPNETNGQVLESIPEENPESGTSDVRSVAEMPSEKEEGNVLRREVSHRYRNCLRKFLQQKSLFMSEQIHRMHVPLCHTVSNNPPNTVEETVSQALQELIDGVVNFVKSQKTKCAVGTKLYATTPCSNRFKPCA